MSLELVFPALGKTLPTDHAYALYAALSGILPPGGRPLPI